MADLQGIVSLLDTRHADLVEQFWSDVQRDFGVPVALDRFSPHFS